jgi:hypothetical protein
VSTRIAVPTPPWDRAQRAAWGQYWAALHALKKSRLAFQSFPTTLTAARVRRAENELDDAIAIAADCQVPNLPLTAP